MQQNNSNTVFSNQLGVHQNLESIVRKHFESDYQKPIAEHTKCAFENIESKVETELKKDTPLLFDSFCGTGISTAIIAKQNPNALVIGLDRSLDRLSKSYNETLPNNAILVQAECADFWCLASQAGWQLASHSIFYPNPYPKSKHLKRRVHAHPAYPLLFELGGEIELRSNWKIYADEFHQAFMYASDYLENSKLTAKGVETLCLNSSNPQVQGKQIKFMTLFEKKYFLSGQKLFSCKLVFN